MSADARYKRLRLRRAWWCWRLSLDSGVGRVEVTCLADEVDAVADWLDEHGLAAQRLPLPVPGHDLSTASRRDYRWTKRAWARYEHFAAVQALGEMIGRRHVVLGQRGDA